MVDDLFVVLDQYVCVYDYKKIVKVVDQILVKEFDCVEVKQCKVVVLIQDVNNENEIFFVLQVIEFFEILDFFYEKVYCLYWCSKFIEVLVVLKGFERIVSVL